MAKISLKGYEDLDIDKSLLVVGIGEEDNSNADYLKDLSLKIKGDIQGLVQNCPSGIKKFGKSLLTLLPADNNNVINILLLGLGKTGELDFDKIRQLGGILSLRARELDYSRVTVTDFYGSSSSGNFESLLEGMLLSLYEFNKFKNDPDKNSNYYNEYDVTVLNDKGYSQQYEKIIDSTLKVAESVFYARDLSNSPPNIVNPEQLAKAALALEGDGSGKVKVKVLDTDQLHDLGLNGIIAVGKGSNSPPKLIVMEYRNGDSKEKPILLVGKGVTFDTGGISIKPSDKMDEMKFDKSGGCTVIGIMKALGLLGIPVNVVGIVPAVENMPSSSSYRPGDIIKMYNGKTVEVLNTDAEGRIILADALSYGVKNYSPKCIVDFATLTGACIIALGTNVAGIMGNNNDLINKIVQLSSNTGEKIWQLPLYNEFFELIKSNVATIKNIGGRTGGTITAAAFLSHFVDDTPWAHIDIAGTAWTQDGTINKSYNPKGSTGFGVRTIVKLLEQRTL
jgi:leucyl aminopeptidase